MERELLTLRADPDPPAQVGVWGEVATGLRSQITTEHLHRLDAVQFGFGVGAVGHDPSEALRHLGEMVVVGGSALWTPAGMDGARTRREPPGSAIESSFMVHWDGRVNAAFRFDQPVGLTLEALLRSVFRALDEGYPKPAEAASVIVLARTTSQQMRDQVVLERMTPDNAPPDGGLIADPSHRDRFFSSNVVSGMWPGTEPVTMLALALVLDASKRWLPEGSLERAFWPAKDPSRIEGLQIHCHAAVTRGGSIPLDDPGRYVDVLASRFLSGAADGDELVVVHVLPEAELLKGVVAVGLPRR